MLRKLLFHALPFLLPFVLYAGWVALARRKAAATGDARAAWPRAHVAGPRAPRPPPGPCAHPTLPTQG